MKQSHFSPAQRLAKQTHASFVDRLFMRAHINSLDREFETARQESIKRAKKMVQRQQQEDAIERACLNGSIKHKTERVAQDQAPKDSESLGQCSPLAGWRKGMESTEGENSIDMSTERFSCLVPAFPLQ